MKKLLVILPILSLLLFSAQGQNPFNRRVRIGKNQSVVRIDTIHIKEVAKVPTKLIRKWESKGKSGTTQVVEEKIASIGDSLPFRVKKKEISVKIPKGYAYLDEVKDKPEVLRIYYRVPIRKSLDRKGRTDYTEYRPKLNEQNDTVNMVMYRTSADTTISEPDHLQRVRHKRYKKLKKSEGWVKDTRKEITVYQQDGITPKYHLVEKYNPEAEYHLKLKKNRILNTHGGGIDAGALIIPMKYHRSFKAQVNGNDTLIPGKASANFNLGLLVGYSYGWERFRLQGGKLKSKLRLKGTLAGSVGLGVQELNNTNTSTAMSGRNLLDGQEINMPIVSVAGAAMVSIQNVKLGFLWGADFGINKDRNRWDHHKRLWIGAGIGYNLAGLTIGKKD